MGAPLQTGSREATPITDEELVAAARNGDRWAIDALYRRYARPVGNMATRLLANQSDAEDVVHDSFLRALSKLDTLREPSRFRGWLFQIAVSECRMRLRKRRLRSMIGFHLIEDASLSSLAREDVSGETRAELANLDKALRRLAPDHRIAWMLRHVEGRSLEEVADHCQCSLATIKRRLKAASEYISKRTGEGR